MGNGSRTPTVDQLRKEIDRGHAADKTPGVDPAAAPLGTDDEAGGNPPTFEQRAMEAEAQSREDPKRPSAGGEATESIRNSEFPLGRAEERMEGDRPTEGGGARESIRADEDMPGRNERAAEVVPSREDELAGALSDGPSLPQGRPSAEP